MAWLPTSPSIDTWSTEARAPSTCFYQVAGRAAAPAAARRDHRSIGGKPGQAATRLVAPPHTQRMPAHLHDYTFGLRRAFTRGGGGIARAYSRFLTSTAWSADTQRWCSGCRWRCSWQVRLASESPCRTTPTQRVRMYPHPRHPPARRAAGTRMRRRCSPPPPPTPRWAARASATGSVCCRLTV